MLKTYVIVLLMVSSCAHNPVNDSPASPAVAQEISKSENCLPNSDIENNSQKQKSFAQVRVHCKKEIESFCKDVECPNLMKPTQVCLMMYDGDIGKDCKKDINRHIKEYQPYIKSLDE